MLIPPFYISPNQGQLPKVFLCCFLFVCFSFLSLYIFLRIDTPPDMNLYERIFLTILSIISVASVITCFSGIFAWILFSEQSFSIDHSFLSYKLTVIFPIKSCKIRVSDIVTSNVSMSGGAITILIRSINRDIHIFYTATYSRKTGYFEERGKPLHNISNLINGFVVLHKQL